MAYTVVAASVRPINPNPGYVVGDVACNDTITAGDIVHHNGTGWAPCGIDDIPEAVALVGGASGEYIPVLTRGRVTGWTDFTAGARVYTAADGGTDVSASTAYDIGFAINTTDLFFTGVNGDAVT
jgi:hypothetical protein